MLWVNAPLTNIRSINVLIRRGENWHNITDKHFTTDISAESSTSSLPGWRHGLETVVKVSKGVADEASIRNSRRLPIRMPRGPSRLQHRRCRVVGGGGNSGHARVTNDAATGAVIYTGRAGLLYSCSSWSWLPQSRTVRRAEIPANTRLSLWPSWERT